MLCGQNTAKNEQIFKRLIELKGNYHLKPISPEVSDFSLPITALALAQTPYIANTLDKTPEQLIVRLDAVDCLTFIEYVLAANRVRTDSPSKTYEQFKTYLRQLRYRDGHISGYSSRLHYLSEWLAQAQKTGWITPVTTTTNATTLAKKINFMSAHAAKYPALKSATTLAAIVATEKKLSKQPICYWTSAQMRIKHLQPGDIVVFVSTTAGLDYSHCGFALRNNTMIHASQTEKKVVESAQNIADYVNAHKQFLGVAVFRTLFNKKNT